MKPNDEQVAHLARLADALSHRSFAVRVVTTQRTHPYLKVANGDTPTLNERVHCRRATDGSWVFWWPWQQPIGSVDDLDMVVSKITTVLRSVEGGP